MTEKELKKLSRVELLEMLIAQAEENQKLKTQLQAVQKQLDDKRYMLEESGSIAEACLKLNGIFEAAQVAANEYVENIKLRSQQQEERVQEAEALIRAKATQMITEADARCRKMESDTEKKCAELTRKAMREADGYWLQVSAKLEAYLKQHSDLRSLLNKELPRNGNTDSAY